MKKILCFLSLLVPISLSAQPPSSADIELVESTPVGTILDNPDIRNTQEVWLEMISSAHRTLDLEEFYVSNEKGKMLDGVLAAMYTAANRGVKIRLIADARMYKTYPESMDSLGRHPNIETRLINFGKIAGGIQHSKYFIVDGKEIFVGSQNFDWRSLEHIHELGLRIRNQSIADVYEDVFNLDWRLAADTSGNKSPVQIPFTQYQFPVRLPTRGGEFAVVTPTCSPVGFIPDSTVWDEHAILSLIHGAKRTLELQFLTYTTRVWGGGTYSVIDDAIRDAAGRGVKVRLIASDWGKGTPTVGVLKALAAVPNIEVAFTAIPEWSGGYIPFARVEHCKYIVADDTTFWLGTANCEKSYFYTTRNLGITGTSPFLAGRLARIFMKSWESPYKERVTQEGSYPPREHGEKR